MHQFPSSIIECKFGDECERLLCTLKHPKVFIN